eukprot:TRINITY_DN664_c0_g2_i9.p1 TRINITY_DN664_c0_g2~~TRINITY_DN664_c0_g2_i9.p1  ORF type:complete len:308 (+),score=55.04 TRINITY_DN664_c0_g2_i9:527-1450(+)
MLLVCQICNKRETRAAGEAAAGSSYDRPLFSGGSIEEYNDQAYQAYQESLVQCPNCGRRFAPDRLQVHLRSCKPGHSSRPISQAAKIKQSGGEGAPGSPPSALKNRTSASTDSAGSRPSSSPKSKRPSTSVRFSLDVEEHCDSPSTASSDSSGQRKSALTHTQKLTAALAESRSGCGQQAAPADECGDQERVQCSYCNRKFAPDRVAQHEAVCQATQAKQRRQFDSSKMRVQGTEVEPFVKKGVGCAKGKPAVLPTTHPHLQPFLPTDFSDNSRQSLRGGCNTSNFRLLCTLAGAIRARLMWPRNSA